MKHPQSYHSSQAEQRCLHPWTYVEGAYGEEPVTRCGECGAALIEAAS